MQTKCESCDCVAPQLCKIVVFSADPDADIRGFGEAMFCKWWSLENEHTDLESVNATFSERVPSIYTR